MTLDAVDRGHFRSDGRHILFPNVFSGFSATRRFNSFFVFDLASLAGTVDSLNLKLELELFSSSDSTLTFDLFDVSATAAELGELYLPPDAAGMVIHNDLGSGNIYATQTVSAANVGNVLTIPLSALAKSTVESQLGGTFAIGLSVQGPDSAPDYFLRFGNEDTAPKIIQLEFSLTPPIIPEDDPPAEPSTALPEPGGLLMGACLSFWLLRKRRIGICKRAEGFANL